MLPYGATVNCGCANCVRRRQRRAEEVNAAFLVAVTVLLVLWLVGVI